MSFPVPKGKRQVSNTFAGIKAVQWMRVEGSAPLSSLVPRIKV